jgi:signal transduction histidine kinase
MDNMSGVFSEPSSIHGATLIRLITEPFRQAGQLFVKTVNYVTAPFRRLPFKLSVAYMKINLVTALVLSVAAVCAYTYFVYGGNLAVDYLSQIAQTTANSIRITNFPNDPFHKGSALQKALDNADTSVLVADVLYFGTLSSNTSSVALIDGTGKPYLQSSNSLYSPATPITLELPADQAALVRTILHHPVSTTTGVAGEQASLSAYDYHTDGDVTTVRSRDGEIMAAAPIKDSSNAVTGALLVRSNAALPVPVFAFLFVGLCLLLTWLVSLIPSLVFGTINGGRFARRLNLLSYSVNSWSNGNFTDSVNKDRSGDEIGTLCQSLGSLPGELQAHVVTRQKLATLEERTRVARNLHDTVKQQAFAAAMQLGAARTVLENSSDSASATSAKVFVANAEKLTNKVQEDLMAIIHDLKPDTMFGTSVSLTELLTETAKDWAQTSGVELNMDSVGNVNASAEVRQELVRILHESLSNVSRHSLATRVTISLMQDSDTDRIYLTISDNGKGFDPVFAQRGLGLYSMRDRAANLEAGQFAIDTGTGKGVAIRVSCLPGESDLDERY